MIKRVRIADLHNDPANVRLHDQRNLSAITASLKTFGQVEPLVVQKGTNKVIGGNGRLAAMRDMGLTECDVVEIEADNVTATGLAITLNRTAELASWDDGGLAETLKALKAEEFDLDAIGFTADEVDELIGGLSEDAGDEETPSGSPGGNPADPATRPTLAERFIVPPFSVLDARQGYWQERKRKWLAIGIQSELGRGGDLMDLSGPKTRQRNYEAPNGGVTPAPADRPGPPCGSAMTDGAGAATDEAEPSRRRTSTYNDREWIKAKGLGGLAQDAHVKA